MSKVDPTQLTDSEIWSVLTENKRRNAAAARETHLRFLMKQRHGHRIDDYISKLKERLDRAERVRDELN